ncbi:MAG: hypothetical protein OXC68_15300 [Aestuariivita sp.]|nr:hypothetical protein [Aestuariivita sp.]
MSIVSRVCASTLWPGKVPGKISLNNPRAAQKTAAVEDRTQTFTQTFRERQERRIGYGYGAPFLRMPVLRFGLARRLTLERGVRQIIQRDDRRPVEQRLDGPEHMVLKRGLVLEEMIGRAIQSHVTEGAKVDPQPLTRGAAHTVHVRSPALVARFDPSPAPAASSSPCCWPSTGQRAARLPFIETEWTQLIGKIQQAFDNPPCRMSFDVSSTVGRILKLSVVWCSSTHRRVGIRAASRLDPWESDAQGSRASSDGHHARSRT